MDTCADRDTSLVQAYALLKPRGILQSGYVYSITCGQPSGVPGGSNMLKIGSVMQMAHPRLFHCV